MSEEKKLINEKKRKELMAKNQKIKLNEAIARILNLRDTKKIMKNNNNYNNRKNLKIIKLGNIVQKFYSHKKKIIIKTKQNLFPNNSIVRNQNRNCQNCGNKAKYRLPVKFISYCSLSCYQKLTQLN